MPLSDRDLYESHRGDDDWCPRCGGRGWLEDRQMGSIGPDSPQDDLGRYTCPRCHGSGDRSRS